MGRRSNYIKFQCFPPPLILLRFRNSLFQRQIKNCYCKQNNVLVCLFWTNAFSISDVNLLYILSFHLSQYMSVYFLLCWSLVSRVNGEYLSMDKATQLTSYNKLTVHCSHLISKDHRTTALPRYFQKLNFSHRYCYIDDIFHPSMYLDIFPACKEQKETKLHTMKS